MKIPEPCPRCKKDMSFEQLLAHILILDQDKDVDKKLTSGKTCPFQKLLCKECDETVKVEDLKKH